MMGDKLLELAERCEAAAGQDRELDGSIAWAIGLFDKYQLGPDTNVSFYGIDDYDRAEIHVIGPKGGRMVCTDNPLRYTASLDAAMTLVPKGWVSTISDWWIDSDGRPCQFADCAELAGLKRGDEESLRQAWADTKPLALCAAALRARANLASAGHE